MYLGELVSALLSRIEVAGKRLVNEREQWNNARCRYSAQVFSCIPLNCELIK